MSIWINGRHGTLIDCRDRGLQYGDGLFETMLVRRRRIRLLELHLERLTDGCRRLRLAVPLPSLERELALRARQCGEGVLKLILTRGQGARGYRPAGNERCTRVLSSRTGPRQALSHAARDQSRSRRVENAQSARVGARAHRMAR
jgi:4-amino-4-deoxychorismate lyase